MPFSLQPLIQIPHQRREPWLRLQHLVLLLLTLSFFFVQPLPLRLLLGLRLRCRRLRDLPLQALVAPLLALPLGSRTATPASIRVPRHAVPSRPMTFSEPPMVLTPLPLRGSAPRTHPITTLWHSPPARLSARCSALARHRSASDLTRSPHLIFNLLKAIGGRVRGSALQNSSEHPQNHPKRPLRPLVCCGSPCSKLTLIAHIFTRTALVCTPFPIHSNVFA